MATYSHSSLWNSPVIRRKVLRVNTETTRPNWRSRLMERLRTARRGSRRRGMISCDDTGLMLTVFQHDGSARKTEIKWNEVSGVVVYKRDLVFLDLICMGFATADGSFEANEEMDGWKRLTDALPQYLLGARPVADWWDKVAQPPFAANPITLFSR
jgi:hypothetical protein